MIRPTCGSLLAAALVSATLLSASCDRPQASSPKPAQAQEPMTPPETNATSPQAAPDRDGGVPTPPEQSSAGARQPALPPEGFDDLRSIPSLRFELAYATTANFTGQVVPGYELEGAWLHHEASAALQRASLRLAAAGFAPLVFDAYRPARASHFFVDWAQANGHASWVREGFIARHSAHARGIAIDLGLWHIGGQEPVDMGGPFDSFDERALYSGATGAPMRARRLLREAMSAEGFVPYSKEWWHFTYKGPKGDFEAPAALDLPYAAPIDRPGETQ